MRLIPHWIRVSVITLLAISAAGYALLCLIDMHIASRTDYSKDPPNQVFQMVLEQPPPTGVTVLRVSGRGYLSKQWVWMRLQAKPETMDAFLNGFASRDPRTSQDLIPYIARNRFVANTRYVVQDQKRAGWEDVAQIARPEVYHFALGPPLDGKQGMLWVGIVIVDRQRNLLFVHAGGD